MVQSILIKIKSEEKEQKHRCIISADIQRARWKVDGGEGSTHLRTPVISASPDTPDPDDDDGGDFDDDDGDDGDDCDGDDIYISKTTVS